MSDYINNLPTDEEIDALAELAAHPKYRQLAQELSQKEGVALTNAVIEYANPEWFKSHGLPLPDGAKVNPRLFENPKFALPIFDLNSYAGMLPGVDDPKNPLNPIINPPSPIYPPIPDIPIYPPIPPVMPDDISPTDPRAVTVCASLGAGVGVTGCISVGT